ncbi:MAG: YncE family protein [Nitrososphaeria archaeon]|nr:YncE family protein [Nitrososphaeria archaeon]
MFIISSKIVHMKNLILSITLIAILAGSVIPYNSVSASPPIGTVTTTINVGGAPRGMAFDPNNGNIYVANSGSNTVSVISSSTNTVVATIPVGSFPVDVTFNPTNGYLYVPNHFGNSVSVINGATNTVVTTISGISVPNASVYDKHNVCGNPTIWICNCATKRISLHIRKQRVAGL